MSDKFINLIFKSIKEEVRFSINSIYFIRDRQVQVKVNSKIGFDK